MFKFSTQAVGDTPRNPKLAQLERVAKPGSSLPRRPSLLQEATGLAVPEARVLSAALDQLVMGTVLDDLTVCQHHNAVEGRNRGQSVSNHDGGATPHEVLERALHERLGL